MNDPCKIGNLHGLAILKLFGYTTTGVYSKLYLKVTPYTPGATLRVYRTTSRGISRMMFREGFVKS